MFLPEKICGRRFSPRPAGFDDVYDDQYHPDASVSQAQSR